MSPVTWNLETRFLEPDNCYQTPEISYLTPGTWYVTPSNWHQEARTWHLRFETADFILSFKTKTNLNWNSFFLSIEMLHR